jgi:hypothetical protein
MVRSGGDERSAARREARNAQGGERARQRSAQAAERMTPAQRTQKQRDAQQKDGRTRQPSGASSGNGE